MMRHFHFKKCINEAPKGSGFVFPENEKSLHLPDYIFINMLAWIFFISLNQRTNGPVNAHLISWPSKAQNIHNLENIW